MPDNTKIINDILVDLFKDILEIEEKSLKEKGINDLSMSEIHTLEAIGMDSVKTMSETAEQLRVTLGTLTIAINRLVKKGYVERLRSESDRRIVFLQLTGEGKRILDIHDEFHKEMVSKMVNGLKVDEDKTLIQSLEKLKSFFDSKY